MPERTYYSTQTTLAYDIQSQIYQTLYLYVAVEFDPPGNHPTSNPRLIAELWCRVATGSTSEDDLMRWESHKEALLKVALKLKIDHLIDEKKYDAAIERIIANSLQDAMPILLIIPHADKYEIQEGDKHIGFESTEVEYVIPNLLPRDDFRAVFLSCGQ